MALVKFNQIAQASGKVNGTIYAVNRGGQYMKTWKKPTNPQTTPQSTVRSRLASLASAWRSLTVGQRDAWNTIVESYPQVNRLGDSYIPSGYQLYMSLNSNLLAAGQSTIDTPLAPVGFTETSVTALVAQISVGVNSTVSLSIGTAGSANETIIIAATVGLSAGISRPSSGLYKQVNAMASAATDFEVVSEYGGVFGTMVIGQKIFARAYLVNNNTGQKQFIGLASYIVDEA